MLKQFIIKILQYFVVIMAAITINFLLPRLMPGDPIHYVLGEDSALASQEQIERARAELGLDLPVHQQYLQYISKLLKGDMGWSFRQRHAVSELILSAMPWTLLLAFTNLIVTTILGITLGSLAAWKRGTWVDTTLNNIAIFLRSVPSFWIAMIFIAIFAVNLKWFPVFGMQTRNSGYTGMALIIDRARHLTLPLATTVLISLPTTFFIMRYSMIETLGEDYITMARVKGLPDRKIKYRHAMRNALLPVVTVVMMNMGYIIGGSTVIETVFNYKGMGRLMYEAVTGRDYPVIQGCFLLITICVIAANLVADIIYPFLDPKVAS